jgi:carboxyl-terminal processing protease
MWQQRRISSLLTVGLLSAFALGASFPEVLAGGQHLVQGGLPEAAAPVTDGDSGHPALEPLSAYYRTLMFLKDHYYGGVQSDTKLTYAAIRGLLRPLDDPYTRFLDPRQYQVMQEQNQGGYIGIGVLLDRVPTRDGYVRIHRLERGTDAERAGLKQGDVILKVDGVSTRYKRLDQVEKIVSGEEGVPVKLAIRRSGAAKPLAVTVSRQLVERPVVESRMYEGRVGLIRLLEFNERSDAQIDRALTQLERRGMQALIFDLRGNPGGTLDAAQEIASRFLPNGDKVVVIQERNSDPEIRPVLEQKHNHRFNQPGHSLPLAVLVNRMSASASEIVAGAIKDYRAGTLIGTTTYGKGLVQTVLPLHGGCAIAITSAHYLTPSGNDINRGKDHRGGVTPDVVVEATEADWIRRNDVQLRKALDLLQQKIGYKRPAPGIRQMSRFPSPP